MNTGQALISATMPDMAQPSTVPGPAFCASTAEKVCKVLADALTGQPAEAARKAAEALDIARASGC